ncbi:MAG: hypothetical protein Q4A32_06085 [Lachnospiraceae bacterium]|nr:hypothetical protein [Lachnospiraceae bacterium]
MSHYSKNREISEAELDQVLGGTNAFSASVMKYQVELDLDSLSRSNPSLFEELDKVKNQLLEEGGRHVFGKRDDPKVRSFVKTLKEALV